MRTVVLLIICLAGAALPLTAQAGTWERVGPGTMPPLVDYATLSFNGRLWILGGASAVPSSVVLQSTETSGVWSSADGVNWVKEPATGHWTARRNPAACVFDGRMWVIGGGQFFPFGSQWQYHSDVWSSPDGVNWNQETVWPGWQPCSGHTATVFNGQIWIMGGHSDVAEYDHVWHSADGVNWSQAATGATQWSPRHGHAATVYNGQMWLTGGADGTSVLDDVWSTTDGVNWNLATAAASWGTRESHFSAAFNGKLWAIGGKDGNATRDDAWSSTDGVNWNIEAASPTPDFHNVFAGAIMGTQLYAMGARDPGSTWAVNDIWRSDDGANWNLLAQPTVFEPRRRHATAVFDNRVWVLGGATPQRNDVWSSLNGTDWVRETASAAWSARVGHDAVAFNGMLWVFGGASGSTRNNEVWNTTDGATWNQVMSSGPIWSPRQGHKVEVFGGRIWVMGGDDGGTKFSDVWSTGDGVNWTLETATPGWSARGHHATASFNGKLWVMGGYDGAVGYNDVWSSSDGVNWTQEVTSTNMWSERQSHAAVVYDNRLWITNGHSGGEPTDSLNDVWYSSDGANWTPDTPMGEWTRRSSHTMANFNGRMWMFGGRWGESFANHSSNEAWAYGLNAPPQITGTGATGVFVGDTYTYHVAADGLPAPEISATGLPAWLNLAGGTLYGVPAQGDVGTTSSITISATNSEGTDVEHLQVTVYDNNVVITSTPVTTVQVGVPYSYTVTATGLPAPTIQTAGLPAWLMFNGSTLAGTPGAADIGLSGTITITADNGGASDTQNFQIDVQGIAPQITSSPVYTLNEGAQYTYTVSATGVPAPTITVAGLPGWLTFDPLSGTISGVPGGADVGSTGPIQVTASNGWGPDAVQTFSIEVKSALGSAGSAAGGGCIVGAGASAWWMLLPAMLLGIRLRKKFRA